MTDRPGQDDFGRNDGGTMRIGIVGKGNMGRSLGILWAESGHDVLFGAREADKAGAAASLAGRGARAGGNDDAAAFGDVVFWGVRDAPASEVLSDVRVLDGKVVLDPNNRPTPTDFTMGPPDGTSHAERLQGQLPRARVVKAFNTMAQEVFELSPEPLRAHAVSVFLAGDDADAKRVAANLAREIGFAPLDLGPLAAARLAEGMADFIRYVMGAARQGPTATISVSVLPAPQEQRLGGRQPSGLK